MPHVRQTSCRFCGQDIEAFFPYRRGTWHDRGRNATCPDKAGDGGLHHAPFRENIDSTPGGKARIDIIRRKHGEEPQR